ncbi:MAG: ribosome silencing factor [Planctomycetes bacterium]|nr:ribosome silencing factor [Planctomycetota bacterium]
MEDSAASTQPSSLTAKQRATLCARVAEEHRGWDIVVLDMHGLTPIFDYFVLVTGTSRRQMHTVADEVDRALHELGERRLGIEGYESARWILLDYGDLVVHILDDAARKFYDLEHLWADAPRVEWAQQ